MNKCLYCYQEILDEATANGEFHKACSQKIVGKVVPPIVNYTQNELMELAEKMVVSQKTVTGVQPKLSVGNLQVSDSAGGERLTIVGLLGEYILKPQTTLYNQLPELEDVTMRLAELSKIITVQHTLIRLKSGELAYMTKRVDRLNHEKLHMEDMCQLTERLTEHKYKGSYEQVAKLIKLYSVNPGLDVIRFYELVLFCFLTGNNDMHLKNFSLLKHSDKSYNLCPAYDLVASSLLVEGDDEELALNLNGKKKKLKRNDFSMAMKASGMNEKTIENIYKKFVKMPERWHEFIDQSFLNVSLKEAFHTLIDEKFKQLELK